MLKRDRSPSRAREQPVLPGFSEPPPLSSEGRPPQRDRDRDRDRAMIAAGVHPATKMPLADNGRTCGDCQFLRRKSAGGWTGWKCGTPDPNSRNHRGDGRDITKRWPACAAFKPKDGEPK